MGLRLLMFSFRRKAWCRSLRRRSCAGLALVAYLLAAGGIPLPAAPPRKDISQPFPCMNSPCGCETAEQCWRGCCCLTAAERWAWADSHGVQPPDYAERPASGGKPKTRPAHSCCSGEECCHDACCEPESSSGTEKAARSWPGVRWVVGAAALRCQGLTTQWVSAGAVLPPELPVAWKPRSLAEGWVPHVASRVSAAYAAPPSPPPR